MGEQQHGMRAEIAPRAASAPFLGEPLVRIDAAARIDAVGIDETVVPVQRWEQLDVEPQGLADEASFDGFLRVPSRGNPAELGFDDSNAARGELRVTHLVRLS